MKATQLEHKSVLYSTHYTFKGYIAITFWCRAIFKSWSGAV